MKNRSKQRLLIIIWLILMAVFIAGIFVLSMLVDSLFLLLILSVPVLSFSFLKMIHKFSFR